MTYLGGKHWDLWVYDTALWGYVQPFLTGTFDDYGPDGTAYRPPADLVGLIADGADANLWRYRSIASDRDLTLLAAIRLRGVCDQMAQILRYADVWDYDPGAGDDPVLLREEFAAILVKRLRGAHDRPQTYPNWPVTDPHLGPLMSGRNPDPFSTPVDLTALSEVLVAVVSDAIESGAVEVSASEPFDSCSGCGGYHNVNWDCFESE